MTAGNVRIEGVYLDRQGFIANRLVSGSTIRVGLSAQGYLFPAPTGIVDYRLRDVGERPVVSVVAGTLAYRAPSVEVDAQLPLLGRRLGVAAGASYAHEEYFDGSDAHYYRFAVIPRWRPSESLEIIPFWSMTIGKDEQVAPTIITAGSFTPPEIPRRRYFGQDWAAKDSRSVNAGVIAKGRIGQNWSIVGGLFRSIFVNEQNFAELFVNTTQDGLTTERIIADPGQRYASTSGELRVSRSLTEGRRLHTVHASVRGRQLDSIYGGAATPLEFPGRMVGERVPVPEPASFAFGGRTHDEVRQTTFGLGYELRWRGLGEASFGVQKADYRKTIELPGGVPATSTRDRPWLLNAAAAAYVTDALAVYASYSRGLEESGLAPNNAANRNEALPAIRTRQIDGGIRWAISSKVRLVAGVFDVRKPYFNTNEANAFVVLGDVRHRGVELSLTARPTNSITVVAGAVLMRPRVTGEGVTLGRVGERPLGQAGRTLRANVEYRPPALPGFSVDAAISNFGRRPSSRDNLAWVEPYTLVDLGARYRFDVQGTPAMLRVQVLNVTNEFVWSIAGSNSYGLTDKRRVVATLSVDF